MDKPLFYTRIKTSLFGSLKQTQVDGLEALINYFLAHYPPDLNNSQNCLNQLAYVLATAYHETAHTMRPIEEYGKGKGYDYGQKLKMSRKPYTLPNQLYYGRGLVQLTWFENYSCAGKRLGLDLLNHPELLLTLPVSVAILCDGMVTGWFTGKRLMTYINAMQCDFVRARRIINGNDKAELIASYAVKFRLALG